MSELMPANTVLLALLIFVARATDVAIAVVRTICVTRGHRAIAVMLGFFESLVWIFAVSTVFARLNNPINIVAFAGGFAAGNAMGMWIEGKLAIGVQILSFISRGSAQAVAERLRFSNYRVTTMTGQGRDGPVAICMAVVPRKQTQEAIRMAREIDAGVVVTVEDVRETSAIARHDSVRGSLAHFLHRRSLSKRDNT
jgi:uncharacterized protein YebE (UPF0316 family)